MPYYVEIDPETARRLFDIARERGAKPSRLAGELLREVVAGMPVVDKPIPRKRVPGEDFQYPQSNEWDEWEIPPMVIGG